MGVYEQPAKKPAPAPAVDLTVSVGDGYITLHPDPSASSSSNTFIASVDVDIELNFQGRLRVTAVSTSPAGGKWTASVVPEIIGPGPATVTLTIKGENLNLAALPTGAPSVQVAQVEFFVTPIF